jgi:hypothetical protein
MIKIDRDGEAYWSLTVDLGVFGTYQVMIL